MEEPQTAQKRLQARALVQAQHMEELFQAPWIRKEFAKHQKPQQAFGPRAGQVALDLPPRSFHQIAKFDMRGTGGFAGTTIEAEIHMLDETRRHGQTRFLNRFD
jgi:hypothetical protein